MPEINRRTFLATGTLAIAGLAVGCKSKPSEDIPTDASINDIITVAAGRKDARLQMIQAAENIPVAQDARVPFALISADGQTRYTGGRIRIWYSLNPDGDAEGPVDATYHGEGLGTKGVYTARVNFASTGKWLLFALGTPGGASGELYGGAFYTVVDKVAGPAVGAKAISVPTPTPEDHRGVEPYCTSTPPCGMHRVSLDVALGNGRPTVFNIGTPRFCTSQVCGPVVDVIETASKDFGDRVNFVHAEVFADDRDAVAKQILAPAPKAWSLESEPITYWIRPDGTIADRIVGPIDVAEVRELTQKLAG